MAKQKQNLTSEEKKIFEEAYAGGIEKQQEFIDKFDTWFGGGSMNDIAETMKKMIAEQQRMTKTTGDLGAD